MQAVYKAIGRVADQNINVLIRGESGTGKELVARAIHQHSHRAGKKFLAVNCAAIPESLLESELFGHEKGAFTGAVSQRIGKFEECDGGTLFLDEVGDMPLLMQSKVLRAIQEKEFQRVGGNQTIKSDAWIVAATNRDLDAMVAGGTFRADLSLSPERLQYRRCPPCAIAAMTSRSWWNIMFKCSIPKSAKRLPRLPRKPWNG